MKTHPPHILLHTAGSLHIGDIFYIYPSKRFIPYGVAFLLICIAILWLHDLSKKRFSCTVYRKRSLIWLYCALNVLLILGGTTLASYTMYQNTTPHKPIVILTQEGIWYKDVMYSWQQISEYSTENTTWHASGVKTKSLDTAIIFRVKPDSAETDQKKGQQELRIERYEIGADFDELKMIFSYRFTHR